MKMIYFKGDSPNFGDELNPYLWPKILPPNFLDEDENELFLGIGSIILSTMPAAPKKFVVGSGYGGYSSVPNVRDGTWEFVFVRGPKTVEVLGIEPEKSICDSAVLLRVLDRPPVQKRTKFAFMPHFESLERGFWFEACKLAGIPLIDPRLPVEEVMLQIREADVLITEAMHGAIVADALRTPWIAVTPIFAGHHSKWIDWSGALSIDLRRHKLRPSSVMESWVGVSGGRGSVSGRSGRWSRSIVAAPANHLLTYFAANRLTALKKEEPQLSSDANINRVTERAYDAVQQFVTSRSNATR
jgi:succinoglycan biosynthesis protein ExoV